MSDKPKPKFYCQQHALPHAKDPDTYLLVGEAAAAVIADTPRYCATCKEEIPFGQSFAVWMPPEEKP